ncbi:MAG TPA: hybrid sensor histidine kinase/response regulator [Candidatus Obscuribacterales bacterium]
MQAAKILIVDDTPANLSVLVDLLDERGYRISVAESGESALEQVSYAKPDLILLDVMMPGLDGFETCRRLKAGYQTAEIPVLFMSALSETVDKVRGFSLGAVDYVTKPFEEAELLARIKTHVELKQARDKLSQNSRELNQLNENLVQANYHLAQASYKLSQLNQERNELMGMLTHDLKNPLGVILGGIRFLKKETTLSEKGPTYVSLIERTSERMLRLLQNWLDLNAVEEGRWKVNLQSFDLVEVLSDVLAGFQERAVSKGIRLQTEYQTPTLEVLADRDMVTQICENLVSNALKYSPLESAVRIQLAREGRHLLVKVQDHGPGISPEEQTQLFKKFTRLSAIATGGEHSNGLGLSIVKKFMELLQGEIWCESEPGQGATFCVRLPLVARET